MLFNSYSFIFAFLPLVVAGFFLLPSQGLRVAFIVLASYVFYAYEAWWVPALMLGSTPISFTGGQVDRCDFRPPSEDRARGGHRGVFTCSRTSSTPRSSPATPRPSLTRLRAVDCPG